MSNSKTSKGFANVSIKVCKYIIMAVIIIVCATTAYNYSTGVEAKPGTDMTVTIKKGTTIKELANTLEEYGIISDTTVFRVQAYVYNTKSIKAGQYTFNTSQNAEELFNKIKEGPGKTKSTKSTKTKAKSKSSK
mgnify:CR=1 FL=1